AGCAEFLPRTQLTSVALPLATRFPVMLTTTIVLVAVALIRAFLLEPRSSRRAQGVARGCRRRVTDDNAPSPLTGTVRDGGVRVRPGSSLPGRARQDLVRSSRGSENVMVSSAVRTDETSP